MNNHFRTGHVRVGAMHVQRPSEAPVFLNDLATIQPTEAWYGKINTKLTPTPMTQTRINEIADELRQAIAKDNDAPRMIREAIMPLMMTDPLKEIISNLDDIAEEMDAEGFSTDDLLREIRALQSLTV